MLKREILFIISIFLIILFVSIFYIFSSHSTSYNECYRDVGKTELSLSLFAQANNYYVFSDETLCSRGKYTGVKYTFQVPASQAITVASKLEDFGRVSFSYSEGDYYNQRILDLENQRELLLKYNNLYEKANDSYEKTLILDKIYLQQDKITSLENSISLNSYKPDQVYVNVSIIEKKVSPRLPSLVDGGELVDLLKSSFNVFFKVIVFIFPFALFFLIIYFITRKKRSVENK